MAVSTHYLFMKSSMTGGVGDNGGVSRPKESSSKLRSKLAHGKSGYWWWLEMKEGQREKERKMGGKFVARRKKRKNMRERRKKRR